MVILFWIGKSLGMTDVLYLDLRACTSSGSLLRLELLTLRDDLT